ncbi:hypothetical protein Q9L42_005545 [Methylomarinum sp. Ch1-1]|uniref:Cytochrome c domain-containing protein n=1 Tax=Methylomarinum roseum TaxID=3067653 RepID=A0AAU7NXD7_9GAMM|nr:hypothetical protein [Methylomarinum sp. Ch1-1]MDP4522333.1 hypothetical protein [Methylomarinum sp. Ch1-1]
MADEIGKTDIAIISAAQSLVDSESSLSDHMRHSRNGRGYQFGEGFAQNIARNPFPFPFPFPGSRVATINLTQGKMPMNRYLTIATAVIFASLPLESFSQTRVSTPGSSNAVGVARNGPAIPRPRLDQADIVAGRYSLNELRRRGLEMFTTPFNKHDGHGDGPSGADPTVFGQRPTTNGTWLRINGLDSQTCQECHAFASMATIPPTLGIGGVAGIANTAFPGVTQIDIEDLDATGIAEVNGRLINPPFLFGAGGIELVGKEMTLELQGLKALAQANPDTPVALVTKGVDFGTITYRTATGFDLSGIEGIDDDLVVRPFGRKGSFATVRGFDVDALQFHLGMQAEQIFGVKYSGSE